MSKYLYKYVLECEVSVLCQIQLQFDIISTIARSPQIQRNNPEEYTSEVYPRRSWYDHNQGWDEYQIYEYEYKHEYL